MMAGTGDKKTTYIPWCFMPPEMHFSSPQDLKEAFWAFSLSRMQEELNDDKLAQLLLPPASKFEKVKNKKGEYILVPTTHDLSFVYRGQTAFYDECKPTLYRKEKSEEEILIERLRCCEFEEYLKQLPEVRAFEARNFKIGYLGLAQHYGLQTNVIDLTNSLEVALFFAMCNMSKDGKKFNSQIEDKEYIGYIYAVNAFEMTSNRSKPSTLYDGRLNVIGMQPFYRPGAQRGFGLHLDEGETLTGLLYSFSYTKQDSELIYNYFNQGTTLWHEDEVSMVAQEISNTKLFSYRAMNKCFKKHFKGNDRDRKKMIAKLKILGCSFKQHSRWEIGSEKLHDRQMAYENNGGFWGINDIVKRKYKSEGRPLEYCLNTQALADLWMFKFPQSGCAAPVEYDSPYAYLESDDKTLCGFRRRLITGATQTKPNPLTKKVDKWAGDWRSLKIDYNRDKKMKLNAKFVSNEELYG